MNRDDVKFDSMPNIVPSAPGRRHRF